jgi:hypothetical protein
MAVHPNPNQDPTVFFGLPPKEGINGRHEVSYASGHRTVFYQRQNMLPRVGGAINNQFGILFA